MIYSIGLTALTIFFFSLLMVISPLLYKRRITQRYSIKNMFPFEFTYKSLPSENLYTYILVALFALSAIGFFVTFDMSYTNGYLIFSMIAGILSSLCIIALFIIPLTNLRLHLIFAVIFFTVNFANAGSMLLASWRSNQEYFSALKIVVIVISIILIITEFVSILNPRLTLNFKAVEKVDEKGEKYYERPKWVVFAFTEWLHIFLFILNIISIAIFTFAK